ncbi:cap-specific mRNA (nucleoside-2'-O-)-methyltransferase 2-like [Daktulosphaira vitifoliae]|uniref:cap-specific mRNA (nucleoside-2'-O-)-methyltransferase 2-like n=1 Tax=Daktulosphaira vitifoliae TaxID=58002 RepID=UPI0021A9C65C|nr:cap-specific mRNA (nucleoside-2'-O-)-methyltransferase 2-like [Daktulosphaira vitifoliae]
MTPQTEHNEKAIAFSKKFVLSTNWRMPRSSSMFTKPSWQLHKFQELKSELNFVKNKLDNFNSETWHAHTTKMNPAGLVISHLKKNIRPDFLTQAWCKFYEILGNSSLLTQERTSKANFNSVHLCEAPGAFISALNHYISLNHRNLNFDWLAMTLNPYHESNGQPDIITDDRLILNTLDKWEFGPDYTGDIFQPKYHEHLLETVSKRFVDGVSLVTADGSIDCQNDPGEQECTVMRLHNYEVMVGLNILKDRGSFVLKTFTIFECNTICRIYLLCCLFESIEIQKPATSKSGNSEIYIICKDYKGRKFAEPFIQSFFESENHENAMFPLRQIPRTFINKIFKCSSYFSNLQIRTIERNIRSWFLKAEYYNEMKDIQSYVCKEFIKRYNLKPIREDQTLMSKNVSKNYKKKTFDVSYAEKMSRHDLSLREEAEILYKDMTKFCNLENNIWNKNLSVRCKKSNIDVSQVKFCMGKPVTKVRGSKFCDGSLLDCRNKIIDKFPYVERTSDKKTRCSYFKSQLKNCRSDTTVCDLTDIYLENRINNVKLQYNCLHAILDSLKHTTNDMLLIGYPLYTQIAIGCLFAMSGMFESYAILKPDCNCGHAFAFFGLQRNNRWLDILYKVLDNILPTSDDYTDSDKALISLLPIQHLIEQKSYHEIVELNNLCLLYEVKPILLDFLRP